MSCNKTKHGLKARLIFIYVNHNCHNCKILDMHSLKFYLVSFDRR